ncbi:MAG: amidohydrolase family protein [Planctomycetaceae bacterium]|nr:amidohydrolase family protein [Planctomycetaceae bacterium]
MLRLQRMMSVIAVGMLTVATAVGWTQEPAAETPKVETKVVPKGPVTAYVGADVRTAAAPGSIKNATILVADGMILQIEAGLQPPDGARVVDWTGKTVLPGIVDPYYVDTSLRPSRGDSAPPRQIVVGGRTIEIPQTGAAVESTELLRIADVWNVEPDSSQVALRSGITTLHWVTSGHGMSIFSASQFERRDWHSNWGELLFTAANNNAESLELIRRALAGQPAAAAGGAERPGGPPGGPRGRRPRDSSIESLPIGADEQAVGMDDDLFQDPAPATDNARPSGPPGETVTSVAEPLWVKVRAGELPLLINASNAATILHVLKILEPHEKVRVALVANAPDVYQLRKDLPSGRLNLIIRPRLDKVANSAARVNIAKELSRLSIPFCFSLSTNQADFQQSQDTPLFPVASLVRTGLDADRAVDALTLQPAKLLGIDKWVGSLEANKHADMLIFDQDPIVGVGRLEKVYLKGKLVYENR